MSNPVPGWYPDPTSPSHLERWWDGVQWSSTTRPAGAGFGPNVNQRPSSGQTLRAVTPPGRRNMAIAVGAAFILILVVAIAAVISGSDDEPAIVADSVGTSAPSTTATRDSPGPTTQPTTTVPPTTTIPIAEYTAAFEAEVARACEVIKADPGLPTEQVIQYNADWAKAEKTYESLQGSVNACAQLARDEALARVEAAERQQRLANCPSPDPDAIVRDPDAFEGQCFRIVVEITQADAATGLCAFRGCWDSTQQDYWFDYRGDNAYFVSGDGVTNCPVISGMDQDDVVSLVVTGTGSLSYDTQIGGSTTVPSFYVESGSVISKG